ncbi:MAG: hypothetical protein JXX14_02245 [Deltaproteobacteria bacterium]|nr:hypothetical protein [Deltaproteobacteria bacterium]
MTTKHNAIKMLRNHLSRLFDARHQGALKTDLSETRGFIDGYICALEDLQVCDKNELLSLIAEERRNAANRADACHSIQSTTMTAEHFAPILG